MLFSHWAVNRYFISINNKVKYAFPRKHTQIHRTTQMNLQMKAIPTQQSYSTVSIFTISWSFVKRWLAASINYLIFRLMTDTLYFCNGKKYIKWRFSLIYFLLPLLNPRTKVSNKASPYWGFVFHCLVTFRCHIHLKHLAFKWCFFIFP